MTDGWILQLLDNLVGLLRCIDVRHDDSQDAVVEQACRDGIFTIFGLTNWNSCLLTNLDDTDSCA